MEKYWFGPAPAPKTLKEKQEDFRRGLKDGVFRVRTSTGGILTERPLTEEDRQRWLPNG